MDEDIHVSDSVLFVHFFKAAKKFGAVIFLKAVGPQKFQNPLVSLWNPVKGGPERIADGDLGILRRFLPVKLHTRATGIEVPRQKPSGRIAPQTEVQASAICEL